MSLIVVAMAAVFKIQSFFIDMATSVAIMATLVVVTAEMASLTRAPLTTSRLCMHRLSGSLQEDLKVSNQELPTLPEGQREIMEIVWDQGEASVFEVREILGKDREVSRTSVRTTMERLEEKGWLAHRVIGRTHFYRPLVSRDVSLGQRIVDIVDKACGGEPERLMAALVQYRGLSADEIQRIQSLLETAKAGDPSRKGEQS